MLIEPENKAILAVAAYIDLNPVRAGLVEDPKDYRFCGYAEAVAGNRKAKQGLSLALLGHSGSTLRHYRMVLFGIGSHPGREGKETISWEKARAVLEKDEGKLPLAVLLRCRLRYFTDGWVLGSESYARKWMSGKKRVQPSSVPVSDPGWEDLVAGNRFRGPVWFPAGG